MALTAVDLAWIRDEIGTADPPSDADLRAWYAELASRTLVALRVLKRRRAEVAGGSAVTSLSIAGAISVGLKGDVAALDRQIARLEALYAQESGQAVSDSGVSEGRIYRTDRGLLGLR